MSINESVSGSLQSYYELVYRNDLFARGGCLLHKTFAGYTGGETYSFRRSRAMESRPIVFEQYFYNRSIVRYG